MKRTSLTTRMLRTLTRSANALRALHESPLPWPVRARIARSHLAARSPAPDSVGDAAGMSIEYLDWAVFRYLIDEIFVHREYHFTSPKRDPLIIDGGSNIGMAVAYFKLLYPEATS